MEDVGSAVRNWLLGTLTHREAMRKLGILGGMGPAATAKLFSRIVDMTDVATDQEHICINILNNPQVPDRTAYILDDKKDSFVPVLQDMICELEDDGCEVIAMPCNAAHSHWIELNECVRSAHFINMLHETAVLLRELGCSRPGLLATDGIIESKVFNEELAECGLETIIPKGGDQAKVMSAIYDYVKAGIPVPDGFLDDVCDRLIAAGADSLILGCTELSFCGLGTSYKPTNVRELSAEGNEADLEVPVVDTIDVLAWRSVIECGAPAKNLRLTYRQ